MLNKNALSQHLLDLCIICDVLLTFGLQLETALFPIRIKDRVNELLTVYELENLAHVTFSLTSKSIHSPWTGEATALITYCETPVCPRVQSLQTLHTALVVLLPLSAGDGGRMLHSCGCESVGSIPFWDITVHIRWHISSEVIHISVVPKVSKFFETGQSVNCYGYCFSHLKIQFHYKNAFSDKNMK